MSTLLPNRNEGEGEGEGEGEDLPCCVFVGDTVETLSSTVSHVLVPGYNVAVAILINYIDSAPPAL